jgi:hypothetical protein
MKKDEDKTISTGSNPGAPRHAMSAKLLIETIVHMLPSIFRRTGQIPDAIITGEPPSWQPPTHLPRPYRQAILCQATLKQTMNQPRPITTK